MWLSSWKPTRTYCGLGRLSGLEGTAGTHVMFPRLSDEGKCVHSFPASLPGTVWSGKSQESKVKGTQTL